MMEENARGKQEELRLEWLADEEEWKKTRNQLEANAVVRLQVRRGERALMLVKVVATAHKDDELDSLLQEALKPVYYEDEFFGTFGLEKSVKLFEKSISWAREEGTLYFNWDEDGQQMKASLQTAFALFRDPEEWSAKIRAYAAEELVGLANNWLQDNEEAEIGEITKEMFIHFMELDSISVYPDGDFEIFFFDGDMFWGHSLIVRGNTNGTFESAEIAG